MDGMVMPGCMGTAAAGDERDLSNCTCSGPHQRAFNLEKEVRDLKRRLAALEGIAFAVPRGNGDKDNGEE